MCHQSDDFFCCNGIINNCCVVVLPHHLIILIIIIFVVAGDVPPMLSPFRASSDKYLKSAVVRYHWSEVETIKICLCVLCRTAVEGKK